MFRAFSFPMSLERSRNKDRLEASLAGLCELELLKQRQEYLVLSALQIGDHSPGQRWAGGAPAAHPPAPVSRAQGDLTLRRQLRLSVSRPPPMKKPAVGARVITVLARVLDLLAGAALRHVDQLCPPDLNAAAQVCAPKRGDTNSPDCLRPPSRTDTLSVTGVTGDQHVTIQLPVHSSSDMPTCLTPSSVDMLRAPLYFQRRVSANPSSGLSRADNSLKGTPWALMASLEQQVGELRVDAETAYAEPPSDVGDSRPSSGFYELSEGPSPVGLSDSSVFREFQPSYSSRAGGPSDARVSYASERPKSVGDLFVANREGLLDSGPRTMVPRSFSAPYPRSLEGISEGTAAEEDRWPWDPPYLGEFEEDQLYPGDQPTSEDIQQAHRVENYILGLIQRRALPLRPSKPRTNLNSEPHKGLARQNSLCRRPLEPGPKPTPLAAVRPASLDYPCSAALEPTSSDQESPEHYQGYAMHRSPPVDDQMVSAQYIPAQQACRAQQSSRNSSQRSSGKPGKSRAEVVRYSPERCNPRPKGTPKKCRFTEDKPTPRKPGRKACRSQSENSLFGQRVALDRKYNTIDRDGGARGCQSRQRRQQPGNTCYRKWRSTLEISQDEGEILPGNQAPRRLRKLPRQPPPYPYNHPYPETDFQERAPLCRPEEGYPAPCLGDSESSLSEADSPGSSSLSSDSDESGGLVWPQQLPPQLARPPSPSSPPCGPQPKAFIKIKASHALKKKILRFRTGSLKVMTTV
ncbi:DCT1B protein, partial [Atractosteus spatula]|nr:DCT1B protein [Atractosteus spatula]